MFTGAAAYPAQAQADNVNNYRILVRKAERKLELSKDGKLLKTYKVVLGTSPLGDKSVEGDGKTPEGEFYIFTKNDQSRYYLSLGLSYPNAEDAQRGLDAKLITNKEFDDILEAIAKEKMPPQYTKLGGEIYIHGGGTANDWTLGCIALSNEDIKEIFDMVTVGTKVTIVP